MWIQFFSTIIIIWSFRRHITIVHSLNEISVPLKYGSKELMLTFPPTAADADYMSTKFCTEKGMEEGDQYDSCYASIYEFLLREVEKHHAKQASTVKRKSPSKPEPEGDSLSIQTPLTITLEVAKSVYNIEYKHQSETAQVAATRFCATNMEAIGVTSRTLSSCIGPVENQLTIALSNHKSISSFEKSEKTSRENKTTTESSGKKSSFAPPSKTQTKSSKPAKDVKGHDSLESKRKGKTSQSAASPVSGVVSVSYSSSFSHICQY
jgi:hypothetical protein